MSVPDNESSRARAVHRSTVPVCVQQREESETERRINAVRVGVSTIGVMKAERRMVLVMAAHKCSAANTQGIVRSGSYGDPAAVPFHVWQAVFNGCNTGTAYTYQWRNFPGLASFCMASVDTSTERAQAKLLGFRTGGKGRENAYTQIIEMEKV